MQKSLLGWGKALAGLVVVSLLTLMLRPVLQAELRWRAIQQRGVLRIGIDPGWQPFSYYDAQGWAGYDAQLATELGKRLRLTIQTDPVGYDATIDALQTDRTDIGLSALTPDPTRTEDVAYTQAYFDAGPRLITRQPVAGFPDLTGQRVGVLLGSEADQLLRHWVRRVPYLQAVWFDSDAEVLEALVQGRTDAALVDALALPIARNRIINANASFTLTADWHIVSLQPRPYVIAVRKDNTALLRVLNQALAEIEAER